MPLRASGETADIHRYPPITRTFFPDGSFDLEWVDTSLRMVDLQTEQFRYKHGQTRLVHSLTNKRLTARSYSELVLLYHQCQVGLVLMLASLVSGLAVKPSSSQHKGPFAPIESPQAHNKTSFKFLSPTINSAHHPPQGWSSPVCS